jgi:hypothetical protein
VIPRLPLAAWVAIGLVVAALAFPWVTRFYGRYYELAAGRPCGAFLELLMPAVRA